MSGVEGTPIAWVRAAGEALIHRDEDCGLFERRFYNGRAVRVLDELPADAVPLVPATKLDQARKVAEWLIAEQKWHTDKCDAGWKQCIKMLERAEDRAEDFEGRYESAHTSRMHAESVVFRLEAEVERLKASPQLPALDTPEAHRMAAARVDADRDERAQKLHLAYINGTTGMGLKWELLTDGQRNGWRAVVDEL